MKVVVYYPYATGEKAFSGGVSKVAVSNIIAVHLNGDEPYLVLPNDNSGLIDYVKTNLPYCHVMPVDMLTVSLYTDVKNPFKRARLIVRNLYKFFTGKSKLRRVLKEIQPDVIHYHEIICYNLLNCYTNCRVVFHLHSFRFTSYGLIAGRFYKQINKYADVVLSPTLSIKKAVEDKLNNVCIVKTPYLELGSSGVDKQKQELFEMVRKEGRIVFSFVGRICAVKRIDHCLKALAHLSEEERKKMKYMIIGGCNTTGDLDYKASLELIIKENSLEDCVEFVGYVNPVESVLPYIDYGVMLTESEAMPMVGIEYLKYSIPTIGYDAPGINDYVIDRINGFVVRNGDVEHLSSVLKEVISQKNLPDFKQTIPDTYKGYSVEKFAEALQTVYKS